MKKRLIALTLALILMFGATGAFAFTAGAAEASDLDLVAANVSYSDSVYLKFAAKATAPDNVKLLVWTAPAEEYTLETADDQITSYYVDEVTSYKVFDYKKLAAKQMTDVVFVRAYADGAYGKVVKYSILEYAYNKMDTAAGALLTAMLEYGAEAQKYFDYKEDRLANADWYKVTVEGGALEDGFTEGFYLPGDVVALTAPETDENGFAFSHWIDSTGANVGTATITVGEKNETYTPVYADPNAEPEIPAKPAGAEWPAASEGLEFDDDGEVAYVLSIGDCTDTVLVIPAVGPNGGAVVGIDGSAFAGEEITAIYFPSTLEEIGRRAFNGCTSLTDVYYDGYASEWENISISTGNDAIEDAAKHFNTKYLLVTFVDYNGRIIGYEWVAEGENATAPEVTRAGYVFAGWSESIEAVTGDITAIAKYTYDTDKAALILNDSFGKAGDKLALDLSILNNPGAASIMVTLTYDTSVLSLTVDDVVDKSGFDLDVGDSLITSGKGNLYFTANGNVTADVVLATINFTVKEGVAAGTYPVTFEIQQKDTLNENNELVVFEAVAGSIIVK